MAVRRACGRTPFPGAMLRRPGSPRTGGGSSRWAVDLAELTVALSDALDLVGVDVVQHGKRVAFIATECAATADLAPADVEDLFYAGVLHDCGVSSTEVHRQLIAGDDWEATGDHCERGFELLRRFPPFGRVAEIVRLHHTHWDEERLHAAGSPVHELANAVFLADRVDALAHRGKGQPLLLARDGICAAVTERAGTWYAPRLVEAFGRASRAEAFWLTLETHHLDRAIAALAAGCRRRTVSFVEVRELARIFARIVDAKSHFTAEHSEGVARLARTLGELAGLSEHELELVELAGLLHDLGKLRVPDDVLDKPAQLDDIEFAAVEAHSFETWQILSRVTGLREVAEIAACHHETLTGDGYPFHRSGAELSRLARIVSVADVFQALVQDRPYRRPLPSPAIVAALERMAAVGKLDAGFVALAASHVDGCRRAASG